MLAVAIQRRGLKLSSSRISDGDGCRHPYLLKKWKAHVRVAEEVHRFKSGLEFFSHWTGAQGNVVEETDNWLSTNIRPYVDYPSFILAYGKAAHGFKKEEFFVVAAHHRMVQNHMLSFDIFSLFDVLQMVVDQKFEDVELRFESGYRLLKIPIQTTTVPISVKQIELDDRFLGYNLESCD
ncbi:hypothetical protein SLE2022_033180 [Rubroshorea leprosula]